jgi:acyl-coenzyme A thioesterase PaaI-like protein
MSPDRRRTTPAQPSVSCVSLVNQPFPLAEFLGLRLQTPVNGIAVGSFDVTPAHLNTNGVVYGVALSALIDTLMACVCTSLPPPGSTCCTVDLHLGDPEEGRTRRPGPRVAAETEFG